jgi:hypothetical protein
MELVSSYILFILGLFNDAVRSSDYIAANDGISE